MHCHERKRVSCRWAPRSFGCLYKLLYCEFLCCSLLFAGVLCKPLCCVFSVCVYFPVGSALLLVAAKSSQSLLCNSRKPASAEGASPLRAVDARRPDHPSKQHPSSLARREASSTGMLAAGVCSNLWKMPRINKL
eukprot:SAG31_NODE_3598_length_4085_cov_4.935273_4_plen_135_part_00